ncbi:hypothetical protein PCK2_000286 [Pneumocystis canis]|nr:hypothetical protein PCK2_000286 [Pneumocystis canis]
MIYFFAKIFPFPSKFMGFYPSNLNTRQFQKSNPKNISEQFIQKFEKKHGTTHIPFFEGGYTEALSIAKKDLMFFMVILQSDLHDDTNSFNQTTLTNENLIQFVINKNILVWAGSVHEPEAFQVSNSLNCTRFPFITISIPHLHSNTSNMSSLARIEGQIRAQQDNAYETSLAIDRERMLQHNFFEPLEPPLNYIHEFNFQLVSPIPRQVIKQNTKRKILEEKNLFPSGNIIGNL